MDISFLWTTLVFSGIAGIISIISFTISILTTYKLQREKIKNAQNSAFDEAIESDNIKILGSFLEKNIGNFSVFEYVSNSEVSSKVDMYIEKIQKFVSNGNDFAPTNRKMKDQTNVLDKYPIISPDSENNFDTFDDGETWNTLARLRRNIEVRLKKIADFNHIEIKKENTAGYLLILLKRKELISEKVFSDLRYCISICNNAVHGSDVPISQANEVISIANRVFKELDLVAK